MAEVNVAYWLKMVSDTSTIRNDDSYLGRSDVRFARLHRGQKSKPY